MVSSRTWLNHSNFWFVGISLFIIDQLTYLSCIITCPSDNFWCCWSGSHEIKRHSLLGRKVITNLDSILKSRNITLLITVSIIKAIFFPVVTYGCESWTIERTDHWRINTFELWCWRRFLRVPWTAWRSNQSILKEISAGCWKDWCWSWNSNTLATWWEEMTAWKRPGCWERLRAGGEESDRD